MEPLSHAKLYFDPYELKIGTNQLISVSKVSTNVYDDTYIISRISGAQTVFFLVFLYISYQILT